MCFRVLITILGVDSHWEATFDTQNHTKDHRNEPADRRRKKLWASKAKL